MKELKDLLTNKNFISRILKSIKKTDGEIRSIFSSEGVEVNKEQIKALRFLFNEVSEENNEDFTNEVKGAGIIEKISNIFFFTATLLGGAALHKKFPEEGNKIIDFVGEEAEHIKGFVKGKFSIE
ncbi:MAG: hypothetical protein LBK29_01665 [Oscillospiraceae bacterium]|jgi:hypothetical protein|nr:hypothetical protein [Oscillospiraceae bacterium]